MMYIATLRKKYPRTQPPRTLVYPKRMTPANSSVRPMDQVKPTVCPMNVKEGNMQKSTET